MFRIISTAVKCFDDVKMNIRQRCRHEGAEIYHVYHKGAKIYHVYHQGAQIYHVYQEGAEIYHVHYIQPLVDRTRDTVLTASQEMVAAAGEILCP